MERGKGWKYRLIMGASRMIGALPEWFLYGCLGRFVTFVLYRLLHYRVKVVRRNLSRAFPEKSIDELRTIERKFYDHLGEVVIDTIDMANISREDFASRLRVDNLTEHLAATTSRSWVAMMAHYGSWEYFGAYQLHDERAYMVGVYHPLRNEAFDDFYYNIRSRFGLQPVKMNDIARFAVKHRNGYEGRPIVYGMIADQRPPREAENRMYDFLGVPTAFFMGGEWLARKFAMPVYFMHVDRVGRAKYDCRWECIYDGAEEVAEGEITRRYAERLEAMIRREPHLWMWSHRRWKHIDIAEDDAFAAQNEI